MEAQIIVRLELQVLVVLEAVETAANLVQGHLEPLILVAGAVAVVLMDQLLVLEVLAAQAS